MKKIFFTIALISLGRLSYAQNMQPFNASNFLVLKVQNPSGSAGNLLLQEYNVTGKRIQQLDLSTLTAPNNKCLAPSSGNGETENSYMSLSADGKYVTFPAYASLPNPGSARVGALVKFDGTINTTTLFNGSSFSITTVTADVNASNSVPLNTTSNQIVAGTLITGAGIPAGTTITTFNTTSKIATLSAPVTIANGAWVQLEILTNSIFTPKSAVTKDGSGIWINYSGLSGSANGIMYQPVGSTGTPTLVLASAFGNGFRQLNISSIDGNLYSGRNNSVYNFFTGTPTTTQVAAANPPLRTVGNRVNGSRGFCFVSANNGNAEVMYVAVVATASQNGAASNATINGSNVLTLSSANANFKDGNLISGPGIISGTKIVSGGGTATLVLSNPIAASLNGQSFYSAPDSVGGIYKFYRVGSDSVWTSAGKFGSSADNYLTVTARPDGKNGFTLFATKNNFNANGVAPTRATQQAMLKAGSDTLQLLAEDANFVVGNEIAGTGFFTGTKILQVNGTQLIVSNKANLSVDTTITLSTNTTLGLPNIVKIDDAAAFNEPMNATEQQIVGGLYQQVFRGISIAPSDVPLPLQLLSFDASVNRQQVILDWATANEKNVASFEVEKSYDGTSFATYKTIFANNGKLDSKYVCYDVASNKGVYYRLKIVDTDGSFHYSKTIHINADLVLSQVKVYPNPVSNKLNISLPAISETLTISIFSSTGALKLCKSLVAGIRQSQIDISNFPSGQYILKLKGANTEYVHSFTKQ